MKYAIVLAAGKGTRMKTNKNKVMHPILCKPMIGHVVDNLHQTDVEQIVVVTGHGKDDIENYLKDKVEYAHQSEQIGTGDAVAQVSQLKGKEGSTLIMFGDCALIQPDTIEEIFAAHEGHDLTILSAKPNDLRGFSRIYRNNQGEVYKIVDSREIGEEDNINNEINLGIYCVNNELLFKYLPELNNNYTKDEINIMDLISIMKENGHKIQAKRVEDYEEFLGVNDRGQLNHANDWIQSKINDKHLHNGVTIIDPMTTYIGANVTIGVDSIIYPNVHIYGESTIGEGVEIRPNSWIDNGVIGDFSIVDASHIVDSSIGSHTKLGPYAHLRAHTEVGDNVRIGNFVEFKNTKFGNNSASAHLTYLGDSEIGKYVNIGCGVVTVNYDGKSKNKTIVEDGAFIGSNSNLIAPITVGAKAVVAAGSTISKNVGKSDMVIARPDTVIKEGYGEKYLKKEESK